MSRLERRKSTKERALFPKLSRHGDNGAIAETRDGAASQQTMRSDPVIPPRDAAAQAQYGFGDDLDGRETRQINPSSIASSFRITSLPRFRLHRISLPGRASSNGIPTRFPFTRQSNVSPMSFTISTPANTTDSGVSMTILHGSGRREAPDALFRGRPRNQRAEGRRECRNAILVARAETRESDTGRPPRAIPLQQRDGCQIR